ncbi:fructuronate reductase [Spelaeicoccus albus]|uniref:Mannitol-1-phosphate 5-dehydrogenase n=1 Tax=Spelaeicoccus albus TaxID=1280376 RepID=A0A7Z0D4I6_9MICO|nr:fructuronate reductase [Spelaeicoccus albus]
MPFLSASTTPHGAIIGASAPPTPGIVHLGLGNFHRAHCAVYTAKALAIEAGEWGIDGFANTSQRVVMPMRAQNYRYSVLELSDDATRTGIVDVHRGAAIVSDTPEAFIASVADPTRRILTLTISELGYCRSSRTGRLDTDIPAVRSDIADPENPHSTIGLIARALTIRSLSGEPMTILSCDNLQSNGRTTRQLILQFLDASRADEDVVNFVMRRVAFPNSMVDRITPATTATTIAHVENSLGVRDRCPVPAEEFSMWVLEDKFAAGRPAWHAAGAIMSDEVEAYELVKLRLLNGSHSLIAYLGALDGRETIAQAWAQPFIRQAVNECIERDYLPSITLPRGFDPKEYIESLSERWANKRLEHRTAQVGSDGSAKLLQRIPVAAEHALASGRVPHMLALTVAAWICAIAPQDGYDPGPVAAEIREPARGQLTEATRHEHSPRRAARAIMRNGFMPPELVAFAEFTHRVEELVETIVRHGARAASRDAVDAVETDPCEEE